MMTKADREANAAHLFELVWNSLVDVLGTATTATLFRKAVRSARSLRPELEELNGFEIRRDGMEFHYTLPTSWQQGDPAGVEALRALVHEALCPLLEELTGTVVIDLLGRLPALREHGIVRTEEA